MYFYYMYHFIVKITAYLVLLSKEYYKTLDTYGSTLSNYSTEPSHLILLVLPLDKANYKTPYLSLNALEIQ